MGWTRTFCGRMGKASAAIAAVFAAFGAPTEARAQLNKATLSYRCMVNGVAAELVAAVEMYGITKPPGGWRATYIWGVIATPGTRIFYGGRFVVPQLRRGYAFTGEAAYAQFIGIGTSERFYVKFEPRGDRLTLIANPQMPPQQQVRTDCQLVGIE